MAEDVSTSPTKKVQPRKKTAPKVQAKKKVRVAPTGRFKFYHHLQGVYIPVTGVEVELDDWTQRQIELGSLREV